MPRGFAVDDGGGEELDEFALGDIVAPTDADGVQFAVLYDPAEELLAVSSQFKCVPGDQRFGDLGEFFGKERRNRQTEKQSAADIRRRERT